MALAAVMRKMLVIINTMIQNKTMWTHVQNYHGCCAGVTVFWGLGDRVFGVIPAKAEIHYAPFAARYSPGRLRVRARTKPMPIAMPMVAEPP